MNVKKTVHILKPKVDIEKKEELYFWDRILDIIGEDLLHDLEKEKEEKEVCFKELLLINK